MATTKFTLEVPSIGYKNDITFKVLKPFRVIIEPKQKYIKNNIVGFDEIPNKSIVRKNYEHLKKQYLQIYDENKKLIEELDQKYILQSTVEYIPNWISMRTGKKNSVELKLDWKPDDWWFFNKSAEERSEEYDCIQFEPHEDFIIEPLNLKGENGDLIDTVTITCKNNNKNPTMLKIVTDNNKIVGAINVFYPKPKKVKIEWAVVGFSSKEIENLTNDYDLLTLDNYFKKAFHTTLIDVEISNSNPHEINITDIELNGLPTSENKATNDVIVKEEISKMRGYMIGESQVIGKRKIEGKFAANLKRIGEIINDKLKTCPNLENNYKIILYLTNLICVKHNDSKKYVNGFTLTGEGVSIMALGNEEIFSSTEIPHEVMHAIDLKHTFGKYSRYDIKDGLTNNYMDYKRGSNKTTYKWQWRKLHQSKFTHEE